MKQIPNITLVLFNFIARFLNTVIIYCVNVIEAERLIQLNNKFFIKKITKMSKTIPEIRGKIKGKLMFANIIYIIAIKLALSNHNEKQV